MTYGELPEHIYCRFTGFSPVVLIAEAECEFGGMKLTEYRDGLPFIHIHGNTRAAREIFRSTIHGLDKWLTKDRHYGLHDSIFYQGLRCFRVDVRHPDYRVMLYCDGASYRFSYMFSADQRREIDLLIDSLRAARDRMAAVFERFFDTKV